MVVVGSGGHASVCVELLRSAGDEVYCCVGEPDQTGDCVGAPVLGGDDHLVPLSDAGLRHAFVAIGDNSLRQRLATKVTALGFELVNAVSPTAVISPSARVGVGVAIMAGAVVNARTEIGDLVVINTGATIDHDCRIGPAAHIAPQSGLAGNVSVGERTFVGIGSSVIPHVIIGDDVTVGAGSVVLVDLLDATTAVGVPATVLAPRREEAR